MSTKKLSSFNFGEMTKTEATIEQYLRRGKSLWAQACRNHEVSESNLNPELYYEILKEKFKNLRQSTIRMYLASSREFLSSLLSNKGISPEWTPEAERVLDELKRMTSKEFKCETNQKKNLPPRTSSHKAKTVRMKDLITLIRKSNADNKKSKWFEASLLMLFSSIHVGLRPIEWRTARLEGKYLIVLNAKNSNNRANGEYRHIDIGNMGPDELDLIKVHMNISRQYSSTMKEWDKHMRNLRVCIYRLRKKYLPRSKKNLTMYSCRHQFSANAKSSGLSFEEVAALMGHASNATAYIHYGRRRYGSGTLTVTPMASEVETVRNKMVINTFFSNLRNKTSSRRP